MRHELQAIKGALGPWSPDAASDSPPTLSPHTPTYPSRGEAPTDVMAHVPSDDVPPPPPADIAAYFPPPPSDAANPPSSPTMSTTTSVNAAAGNRSLSATLSALRSAMQTYDARARMSASAHAAELGAIRQVVAGLRMQLHAVLMELSSAGAGADGLPPKIPSTAAVRFFIHGFAPPPSLPPPSVVSITKL
jgi:hypothetical protein